MILKKNFYVIKFKKNILPLGLVLFTLSLLLFSQSNLVAVKSSLLLWTNSIIPSLLPFFIATELLMYTNIIQILGNILNPIMKPIFNVSGAGSFVFLMGLINGYPTGAKIAVKYREENICTKEECERLLSFTNNSGPLFIIGSIGITMYKSTNIGILLFVSHILASITVGILFRFWKKDQKTSDLHIYKSSHKKNKEISFFNFGEILSESIIQSISSIVLIGGFILVFSCIISILEQSRIYKYDNFFISSNNQLF